jgi:hypothetical protein
MKKHYLDKVRDGYNKGWLKIKLSHKEVFLPYGLLVEKIHSSNQTETIKILEGAYEGAVAPIPFVRNRESYFSLFKKPKTESIVLETKSNHLLINKRVFPVVLDGSIKTGGYFLYLPDYPHNHVATNKYQNEAKGGSRFASTWFRLVKDMDSLFESSFYLHFGTYSEGCVTFPFFQKSGSSSWNELVLALSLLRLKEGVCCKLQII